MNRRNAVAVVGLFVVAVLAGVALYVVNPQAAEATASTKTPPAATAPTSPNAALQIQHLQMRIAQLEQRIAALEKRPMPVLLPRAVDPKWNSPAPPLAEPWGENDGFPAARVLLINVKNANVPPAH